MPARPKKGARFGGSAAHQKAMMANLVASLIAAESITTTEAKAKACFHTLEMIGAGVISTDGQGAMRFRAHGQFGWLNVGDPSFRLVPSGSSRIRRGAILNAVFSPDASQRLICQQNQISRYDCAKLRTAVLIECDEWRQRFAAPVGEILGVRDAVFVADTGLVALAVRFKESEAPKGGRIDVLESNTKNIRRSIPLERLPTNIACSVDGTVLAAGCSDGTVRVWRLDLKRDEQSGLQGAWSAAERTRHLHDGWCVPRTLQELRIENSASVLAALRGAVD